METGHQDPFDFFTALSYFPEIDQVSLTGSLSSAMVSKILCRHNENHFSEREDNSEFYISVNVPQDLDGIKHAIEDVISGTEYLSDWRCDYCDNLGGRKSKRFKYSNLPKYLIVKLNRALRDRNGVNYKNTRRIKPTHMINVMSKEENSYSYKLCGIITHFGAGMETGHYIAEVEYGRQWYKCDDSTIKETRFECLSTEGYGYLFEKIDSQ